MDPKQYPQPNQVPEPIPGSTPPAPQAPTPAQQVQPLPQPTPVPQPVQQVPQQQSQFQPQAQPQPQPEPFQQPQAHHFFGAEQTTSLQDQAQPQPTPVVPTFAATPTTPSQASPNPGARFGLASLILCLVGLGLFGLIFGILGLKKSRRAGMKNPLALTGIILGSLEIVAGIIAIVLFSSWLSLTFSTCQELGNGTHVLTDGRSVTCSV